MDLEAIKETYQKKQAVLSSQISRTESEIENLLKQVNLSHDVTLEDIQKLISETELALKDYESKVSQLISDIESIENE